jgi:hypothetical protein
VSGEARYTPLLLCDSTKGSSAAHRSGVACVGAAGMPAPWVGVLGALPPSIRPAALQSLLRLSTPPPGRPSARPPAPRWALGGRGLCRAAGAVPCRRRGSASAHLPYPS